MLNKNTIFGDRKNLYEGEGTISKLVSYDVRDLRKQKLLKVNKTKKFLALASLVFFVGVFFGTVLGLISILNSVPSAQANAGDIQQLLLPSELISSPR
jgi:hypothetical protein